MARLEVDVNIAEALRHNYLFRGLTEAQRDAIIGIAREEVYDGGQVMVRQFDRRSDLLIILTGGALIKGFSDETLAEVGPGSAVGEVSLVDDQPRSATVVATGTTSAALIPSADLGGLMDRDPVLKAQLFESIGKLLCQRLRTANIQLDAALARGAVPR
jgi:CRP-like cAMP-binding protein